MNLNEFKSQGYFFTATGKWKVVDVGVSTVVAHRIENSDGVFIADDTEVELQDNLVFYESDFGGCWTNQE